MSDTAVSPKMERVLAGLDASRRAAWAQKYAADEELEWLRNRVASLEGVLALDDQRAQRELVTAHDLTHFLAEVLWMERHGMHLRVTAPPNMTSQQAHHWAMLKAVWGKVARAMRDAMRG